MILAFSSVLALAQAPAPNCEFKYSSNAKACPTSGSTLLDDTYPIASLVISVAPFRKSSSSAKVPVEFILNSLQNYDFSKDAPSIIVPAREEDFQRIRAELEQRISASNGRIPKSILEKVIHTPAQSYTWQQDYFESFVDLETGRPSLRRLESYNRGDAETAVNNIVNVANSCGISQGAPLTSDHKSMIPGGRSFDSGEMGGNIEGLPGGLCMVGDNLSPAVSDQFCGSQDNVVQIDVSWLAVGHVDEVVKVLPSRRPGVPAECNFTLTYASPKKAMELLNQPRSRNFPFFSGDFLSDGANNDELNEFRSSRSIGEVGNKFCRILMDAENARKAAPDSPSRGGARRAYLRMRELILSSAYAGAGVVSFKGTAGCGKMETLTNAEFLTGMNHPDFKDYNDLVEAHMQASINKIKDNILRRLPQCARHIDIVPVPDLFYGTPAINEQGVKSLPRPGDGGSFIPNPTNSVVAGQGVIFSDPQNALFRDYLTDTLRSRGLRASYIDTWDYSHLGDGNLHCSSHTIPYCQPNQQGRSR